MQKRGLHQVDWAISLAIFLLYLSWFFIFIRPVLFYSEAENPLASIVYNGFETDTAWSMEKMPLFARLDANSSLASENVPVIAAMPTSWNESNIRFLDNRYFVIDRNRIIFLADLGLNNSFFWIIHSNETYNKSMTAELSSDENVTTTRNARFEFSGGVLSKAYFDGAYRVNDFSFLVNNEEPSEASKIFTQNPMYSKNQIESSMLTYENFIFANNTVAYQFLEMKNPNNTYLVSLHYALYPYAHYYINNEHEGEIDYAFSGCISHTTSMIDFYNNASGIALILDSDATFTFCTYGDALTLDVEKNLTNGSITKLVLHYGDYQNIASASSISKTGMQENMTGISPTALDLFNATESEYEALKIKWNYPKDSEFGILFMKGNVTLYSLEPKSPGMKNAYVKKYPMFLLYNNGTQEPVTILIQTW